jgi:para-nitrobenzyl esterase
MPQYVAVDDDYVLPANSDDPTAPAVNDAPMLTGFTADEVLPSGDVITSAEFEASVRKRYGATANRILTLYLHADDAAATESQGVLARDRYTVSLLTWASARRSATTQPIFLYLFDHPYPIPESMKCRAFHTSDVPYSMGNLTTPGRQFTEVDRRLSEFIQDAWLSFMASSDPTRGGGLPWHAYRPGTDEVMRLSRDPGQLPGVSSAARLDALREFVHEGGRLSLF